MSFGCHRFSKKWLMGYLMYHSVPIYFMIWPLFKILGQKFDKFFIVFFGKFKKSKIHSEINWPLVYVQQCGMSTRANERLDG